MNKSYVLFNLKEAQEALASLIKDVETDPEFESGGFSVDIGHIYHHLNHAWNAQDIDSERTANLSHEDFIKWDKFPSEVMITGGSESSERG